MRTKGTTFKKGDRVRMTKSARRIEERVAPVGFILHDLGTGIVSGIGELDGEQYADVRFRRFFDRVLFFVTDLELVR